MKPYLVIALAVLIFVSICNTKLNIFKIIKQQFLIYKNDKTKKLSCFDIFTFFINPLLIAVLLVFIIDYKFVLNLFELIVTILSIIATILFSFLALLIDRKSKSNSEKVAQVSNETYISIIMTIIYSLIALLLTIGMLLLPNQAWILQVFNGFIYYFLIKILFNILMILKRMFLLLEE